MEKALRQGLIVVVAALCITLSTATIDADELNALIAIRTHLPALNDGWYDSVLPELCRNPYNLVRYLSCKDGHVSGLDFFDLQVPSSGPTGTLGNITGLRYLEILTLGPYTRVGDLDIWYTQLPNLTSLKFWNYGSWPSIISPKFSGNFTANPMLTSFQYIDSANNPDFPSEFVGAPGLKSLWIGVPNLVTIANNLLAAMNLTSLSFRATGSQSRLRELPDLSHLTYLETLDLAETWIEELADIFTNFTQLRSLELSMCRNLVKLPPSLSSCVNLETLSCPVCRLNLADSLPNLSATRLNLLDLQSNAMTIWPDGLCQLSMNPLAPGLRLELAGNPLIDPPACLANVVGLQTLTFQEPDFSSFPSVFASMSSLVYLNIYGAKKMTGGIPNLSGMTSLTNLFVYSCSVTGFPTGLPPSMETLYLVDNNMTGVIPDDAFTGLSSLSVLHLTGNRLTGPFPSSIGDTNMGYLYAERNSFTTLPDSLGSLTSLSEAIFRGNKLHSIPTDDVWRNMTSLQHLDLSNNRYLNLPLPVFWSEPISKAFIVDLSGCSFTGNVPSINSTSLATLILSDNALDGSISPPINAPNLYTFRVDRNSLQGSIPSSIGTAGLPSLGVFDISYNRLTGSIPTSFSNLLSTLTEFSFNNNGIEGTLPNLNLAKRLLTLNGHTTNIRLCDVDPSLPYLSQCSLYDVKFPGSCGCEAWYTRCTTNTTCPSPDYVAPLDLPGAAAPTPVLPPGSLPILPPGVLPPIDPVHPPISPPPEADPIPVESEPILPPVLPPLDQPVPVPVSLPLPLQSPTEGSVVVSSVTLPAHEGIIVVSGNLSVNESLTFDGLGTTIVVGGCVENIPQVVIILKGDEKLKTTNLLSQKGADCPNDLATIPVKLVQDAKNCKQVKSSTKESTRSSLVILFDVDATKCNIRWIILGSVLGGVAILTIVVLTALYHSSPVFRTLVRSCRK